MHWAQNSISNVKELYLPHRNWNTALSYSHAMLFASSPGEVVCITGPSRAGKSRLINSLEELLVCDDDFEDTGLMSVVKILATNCSVKGTFSSKAFTLRGLEAVKHPFYSENNFDDIDWGSDYLKQFSRTPETALRPAFEKALIHRKTKYVFIDEAQHVLYAGGGDKEAGAILNSWKCLAQDTDVVLVLVGAYPLLEAVALCPHLIGRKHQIHLPRYRTNDDDLKIFLGLLDSYSEIITLPPNITSLSNFADLLYEGSFGCIGLLESWIREALALVMAREEPYLTKEHFLMSKKIEIDRQMVATEIKNGEDILDEIKEVQLQDDVDIPIAKKQNKKPFVKNPRRHKIAGRS